ncbi:hypothetical protein NIES2101_41745 [Calothrix sp. HK-06]|nr:hypothetical protein NIES2101_41745 [Calothrix sp. HK-06]
MKPTILPPESSVATATSPSIPEPAMSDLQLAQVGPLQSELPNADSRGAVSSSNHIYEVEVERLLQSHENLCQIALDTQKVVPELVQFRELLTDCNRKLRQQMGQKILGLEQEIANYKRQLALTVKKNIELTRIASLDELTQIANRRQFDQTLDWEWGQMLKSNQPLSLIIGDVDYFKGYNDIYGHPMGDFCLKQVAKAMSDTLQPSGNLVARYGGEEFVILLPNTSSSAAIVLAEKVRIAIEQMQLPHPSSNVCAFVTMSMGVSSLILTEQTSVNTLLAQADTALYKAKKSGRNRVCRYSA